ncbi:MAG TPA: DUF4139 domain-containing protein [Candidatus Acidoferrum sp.]|nr:DUF4139 domain-containing protein [Candidatus Acidoferrum sp.]
MPNPKERAESYGAVAISSFLRHWTFVIRHFAAIIFLGFVAAAIARINVVTLPDRDTVQLTIYNSVDLTLVRETRHLTFRKGLNKLEFSWANTLIDPTSVEFKPHTHADEVEVLDVSFPPRVANTLEWRINSEFTGDVIVEIQYFTSGISWSADYVAEAARDEKLMNFAGSVRVNNRSGEDYENAQVRLVVGVIRLVEEIAELARRGEEKDKAMTDLLKRKSELGKQIYSRSRLDRAAGVAGGMAMEEARKIVKEGVSEYFLFTVEGRDTIQNGWSKRMPSFRADAVPVTSYYKFEKERWDENVMRYYRFTNSTPSQLGNEPLPDGAVKAFRLVSEDHLYSFVGSTSVKYIPLNEFVELELGPDREVMVKPSLTEWQKTDIQFDQRGDVKGWTVKETWRFEVQNSKDIPVMLDIRRNFSGDWSLTTAATYEKVDAAKVKFVIPLAAREKQTFSYEAVTRHGTSATK